LVRVEELSLTKTELEISERGQTLSGGESLETRKVNGRHFTLGGGTMTRVRSALLEKTEVKEEKRLFTGKKETASLTEIHETR